MGINTIGFIYGQSRKQFTKEALTAYLSERYDNVSIYKDDNSFDWNYMVLTFKDGEDQRQLRVHYNYTSFVHERYPKIDDDTIVLFNLGCWGNSVQIIKGIVTYFGGGYFIKNDCADDWEIVSSDHSIIPEIKLHYKIMIEYKISEKEATNWIDIFNKVRRII